MIETSPADLRAAAQMHLREGRFAEATDIYRALAAAEPFAPDLRYGLGAALMALGDHDGANDVWATARVFHGLALLRELGVDMDRFAVDADYAAETGRGLAANGLPGVAAAALARALEILGPQMQLLADYAVCLIHQGAHEEACEVLTLAAEDDAPALNPLLMAAYGFADDNGLRRSLLARQSAAALEAEAAPFDLPAMSAPAGRALKVGYIAGASPIDARYLAVIASHDPQWAAPLLLVESAQIAPDGFPCIAIGAMSDQDAARAVATMNLDILVDLAGPAGGRLGVFAFHAAPIQISWNSEFSTTGLTRMDAKLLPAGSVEPDAALLFSEPLIEMGPVLAPWPRVEIAPRAAGRFTLGAFMAPVLMTAPLVAALARIVLSRPDAKLMLKHPVMDDPVVQRVLAAKFLSHGVPREKLDFRSMSGDDLDLFDIESVDLAIDSRPSMGEGQVLSLLGQGVPVLCAGEPNTAGNLALAPLRALGLAELATDNLDRLAERAIMLAHEPAQLAAIRDKIEAAFTASAYGDVRRVAADLQRCFDTLAAGKAASMKKSAAA